MSDLKSKKVFDAPLNESKSEPEELTVKQVFNGDENFVVQEVDESQDISKAEQDVELVIRPKKGRKWLVSGIVVTFAGLVGWQAVDSFITAIQAGDWLAFAWAAFIAGIASLGIGAIFRELWKLRSLRCHFDIQEYGEQLLNSDSIGKGVEFCESVVSHSSINKKIG